jgi:hypothetical protein
MKHALLILALFLATSAHAGGLKESAESYYARHMKSCERKPRESVWDLFAATRTIIMDECCVKSVRAMQAAGEKRIAPEGACPSGKVKKSLPCETSKHWCEGVER